MSRRANYPEVESPKSSTGAVQSAVGLLVVRITRQADNIEWVSSKSNTSAEYVALNSVSGFFGAFYFLYFVV